MNEFRTRHVDNFFEVRCPGNSGFEWIQDDSVFSFRSDKLRLVSETQVNGDGVYKRKDSVSNIPEEPVSLSTAKSKFVLPDGDYEVCTQFNNWLHESSGGLFVGNERQTPRHRRKKRGGSRYRT